MVMAEVTNELLYDVLKPLQTRLANVDDGLGEVRVELR